MGNSQDAEFRADESGSGYAYDFYSGSYTVSSGDTISSGLVGDTSLGAVGDAFDVGDSIFALGWKTTETDTNGDLLPATGDHFLKFDPNGNNGWRPASAPGGAYTSFSGGSDQGDFQLQNSRNNLNFQFKSFLFNGGASGIAYQYNTGSDPVITDPRADLPIRAFGVEGIGSGTGSGLNIFSQIYLINVTDLNVTSFDGVSVGNIGEDLQYHMYIGGGGNKTGVVVVPEPSSYVMLTMLCLGGLAFMRRRRTV